MNANFHLDTYDAIGNTLSVQHGKSYSSAMSASALDGGPCAAQHFARDARAGALNALEPLLPGDPTMKPYRSSAPGESYPRPELPFGFSWSRCPDCGKLGNLELCHPNYDGESFQNRCVKCFSRWMGYSVVLLIPQALLYCCSFLKVVALV